MLGFWEKRSYRRFMYSRASLVVILAVVVLLGRAAFVMYGKEREARRNAAAAAEELVAVKEREEYLEKEIARLETERGVEEEIRKKFRVVKEGEQLIVLVDSPSPEPATTTDDGRSFFGKLVDILNPFD
jgi:cell division protein FtsB